MRQWNIRIQHSWWFMLPGEAEKKIKNRRWWFGKKQDKLGMEFSLLSLLVILRMKKREVNARLIDTLMIFKSIFWFTLATPKLLQFSSIISIIIPLSLSLVLCGSLHPSLCNNFNSLSPSMKIKRRRKGSLQFIFVVTFQLSHSDYTKENWFSFLSMNVSCIINCCHWWNHWSK